MSHPARIGLTNIHGPLGLGVRIGQGLARAGFSQYEHSFMDLGDGTVIEAEPGGARIVPLLKYQHADVYWCDHIYTSLSMAEATRISQFARRLKGTPYSFLDYDALAMHYLHIPVPGLRDYIKDTGHLICSQLVDLAYNLGGVHLFPDVWEGYVMPGMLWQLDRNMASGIDWQYGAWAS